MNEMETINIIEEEERDTEEISKLGIGGWLVVLLVYICLRLALALYNSISSIGAIIQSDITLGAIVNVILIVVYIVMIIVFAKKRYYFVKLATMTFILIAIYSIVRFVIDIVKMSQFFFMLPSLYTILLVLAVLDIVVMILWIAYLSKSDRVYNTFRDNEEHHTY